MLIVIGGDAAGISAGSLVRKLRPETDITVFERGPHTSFSARGISYYVTGLVDREEALIARTPQTFRKKHNIQVYTRHEVTIIDPGKQKVLVKNLNSSTEHWEHYDQLLIATRASPIRPHSSLGREKSAPRLSNVCCCAPFSVRFDSTSR